MENLLLYVLIGALLCATVLAGFFAGRLAVKTRANDKLLNDLLYWKGEFSKVKAEVNQITELKVPLPDGVGELSEKRKYQTCYLALQNKIKESGAVEIGEKNVKIRVMVG